jgi:hypothetical protein
VLDLEFVPVQAPPNAQLILGRAVDAEGLSLIRFRLRCRMMSRSPFYGAELRHSRSIRRNVRRGQWRKYLRVIETLEVFLLLPSAFCNCYLHSAIRIHQSSIP